MGPLRSWLVVLASLATAASGIALFVASFDVLESSLARSVLPVFAWRPKDPNARPLPDAPSSKADRVQR